MTFVYARGIWSVKHSHSHSRLNHLPHSPRIHSLPLSLSLSLLRLSLSAEQPPQPRQAVSKCKPNRSLDRLGDGKGGGGFAQWISIGFSAVFWPLNACCNLYYRRLCLPPSPPLSGTACVLRLFCLCLKLPSIRKLNFLEAFFN